MQELNMKGLTLFDYHLILTNPEFSDFKTVIDSFKHTLNTEDDELVFPIVKIIFDSEIKKVLNSTKHGQPLFVKLSEISKQIKSYKEKTVNGYKVIETKYKGYRFRSRLEAKWAVFFDALGIDWVYEIEGYKLTDGRYYLPDFLVTTEKGDRWFIEVKGNLEDKESIQKAKMLDKHPPDYALGCLIVSNLEFCDVNSAPDEWGSMHFLAIRLLETVNKFKRFNSAIATARSARFEHGEVNGC
jgi:hypothetical protein